MLVRSPVEEQLRLIGGEMEGWRLGVVEGWMGWMGWMGGMGYLTIVADAGALTP